MSDTPGICDDEGPIAATGQMARCELPKGHNGSHTGTTGMIMWGWHNPASTPETDTTQVMSPEGVVSVVRSVYRQSRGET